MSREQDSVAAEIRAYAADESQCFDANRYVWAIKPEKLVAWADRLTREAAPQASGGDELPCTDSDNCRRCSEDADTPHSGIPRGTLATTDSAIQSQQDATGGAVDCPYCTTGNCKTCEDAHPQAAGSAPGEARVNLDELRGILKDDPATAAGSAPVGVDAKDGAS